MVQVFRAGDRAKRVECSNAILRDMENYNFLRRLIFSDEATFHTSGKVNRHNLRICEHENQLGFLEYYRDSLKVNVFCAASLRKFMQNTFAGQTYFKMLQQWLFPK